MPDKRTHRGPHPRDQELFSEDRLPPLRQAVADLSWHWTRGYAQTSSLKIVGDRYGLTDRQRLAVLRSSCSDGSLEFRKSREVAAEQATGRTLEIDGFNLLMTIEAALGGGVLLLGRDGCLRDLASVHGTYRKVSDTLPALRLLADWHLRAGCASWVWRLDRPVSNSGRLKTLIEETAKQTGCQWQATLDYSPDALLKESPHAVVTADSQILDAADRWVNLARHIVETRVPDPWIVDVSSEA